MPCIAVWAREHPVQGLVSEGTAMADVDVPAGVFCSFDLERLCIAPELVGAKHEFVFDGMQFALQLTCSPETPPILS
jgi:hypothetical protein